MYIFFIDNDKLIQHIEIRLHKHKSAAGSLLFLADLFYASHIIIIMHV